MIHFSAAQWKKLALHHCNRADRAETLVEERVERTQKILRDHLLHLMRQESEDRWAAGWLIDLEYTLSG